MLTIIAFLSAVVGAVFTRFVTDFPWPGFDAPKTNSLSALTFAAYVAFLAYVLLVTVSVLIILKAVKPQFNVPKTWTGSSSQGLPPSMLFYARILDVTAPTWGDAFIKLATDKGNDLKAYYAKCYIAESYLVAGKVAEKLRLLSPGVGMLRAAMWVTAAFLFPVRRERHVHQISKRRLAAARCVAIGPTSDSVGATTHYGPSAEQTAKVTSWKTPICSRTPTIHFGTRMPCSRPRSWTCCMRLSG
ncbi:hypothetical protein QIH87_47370 [Bradyrhizobium elkanii]|uniref:hypothetical protein n=1 Tax=Bradyrhizobium elkanii TaxID=29448 RepID=UPI002715015A|nr:hypothetical protein [Bradyrhizobium elkanii]WLB09475.1 hypothetical protein QIH87_47370 [Bradyrhizobium elkanii]WLB72579.1 hypothetical protein QIH89_00960 [Bradyrhizobium elkanii]